MVEYRGPVKPQDASTDRLIPPFPFAVPEQLRQTISTFGSGEVGRREQQWIKEEAKCEAEEGEQESCGKPANASVDFDIPLINNSRGPESILACEGHVEKVWMAVQRDLISNGRTPSLTLNGQGRA